MKCVCFVNHGMRNREIGTLWLLVTLSPRGSMALL